MGAEIRALGKGGRLVTSGATSGPIGPTDIRYLFRREQRLMGSNGWTHDELLTRRRARLRGKLRPVVDRVLPLAETAAGRARLERRQVFGKVIIRLRGWGLVIVGGPATPSDAVDTPGSRGRRCEYSMCSDSTS